MFQTCNEFGYFQTTDGKTESFGKEFPLKFFVKQCEEVFGPKYNDDYDFYNLTVKIYFSNFIQV